MRMFFHSSDHLTDRAFCCLLCNDVLPKETQITPDGSGSNNRDDMADFPTEDVPEMNGIYLKYYADDAERDYWKHQFQGETIPRKTRLPCDRDHRLPLPPEEQERQN